MDKDREQLERQRRSIEYAPTWRYWLLLAASAVAAIVLSSFFPMGFAQG